MTSPALPPKESRDWFAWAQWLDGRVRSGTGGGGGTGAVASVNGKTGTVVLNAGDVGAQPAGSYAAASHTHPVGQINASGTASSTTFLRGDGTWATPPAGDGTSASVTDATTTTKGIVELATTTETTTGTDTTRAVTPAGLKTVADSKADVGHTHAAADVGAVTALTSGLRMWKGTQAQYDALGTYDDNTIYLIPKPPTAG